MGSYGGGDRSFGSAGGDKFSSYTGKLIWKVLPPPLLMKGTDRGFSQREELPLPSKPPYTVHLGNMSFDATEGDVQDFFAGCEVTSVRIVEDKMDRKPKGFGYAEFGSLDGLKKALALNGSQFQGRNMRISVAEPRRFGDTLILALRLREQ
jgi:translation initiation factor 4B